MSYYTVGCGCHLTLSHHYLFQIFETHKLKPTCSSHPVMDFKVVDLVGAGRIKSRRLSITYTDAEGYDWSSDEREKELAKAVSRKTGIPAKNLTVEFFRWDGVLDDDEDNGEWISYWTEEDMTRQATSDILYRFVPVRARIDPDYVAQLENAINVWQEDIFRMQTDTDTADFVLRPSNGSKVFSVHKAVLSNRSTVFRDMFARNMTEVVSGEAIIQDIDDDTLEDLIHFLYTGGLSGLNSDIISLCYAANKYELPSLMGLVRLNLMSVELSVSQLANLFLISRILSNEELFELAKAKLTEGLWDKGVKLMDVLDKGVRVKKVLEMIELTEFADLTKEILALKNIEPE